MTRLYVEISTAFSGVSLSPTVSFGPFSRSYLKKHISVDGSKPVQLSVKQDGAVDVFEMQVILPTRTALSDTAFGTLGTESPSRSTLAYSTLVHVMYFVTRQAIVNNSIAVTCDLFDCSHII